MLTLRYNKLIKNFMRQINAEELAILLQYYIDEGNIEKTKQYEQEFNQLQAEHNKDN